MTGTALGRMVALVVAGLAAGACGADTESRAPADRPTADRTATDSAAPAPPPGAPSRQESGASRPPVGAIAAGAPPAAGDTIVAGRVRAVGAAPLGQIVVRPDGGGAGVAVRGPLRDEVARLVGAEVRVWGRAGANQPPTPPRAVTAAGYDIMSIGGARPVVGTLLARREALWLVAGDTLQVRGAPPELAARAGARVWILGVREGDTLRLQSYGILREPGG